MVWPLNLEIAFCASWSEAMVTNAKPRDLPVNLSCMSITSWTVPAWPKSSCSSFSVVLKGRFPTYNLFPIEFILETPLGHCSRLSDFKSPLNKLNWTIHQLPSFRFRWANF